MIALRPSQSHIWTKCFLAPRLIANARPEEAGDPAREGTCAAWVAEMVLTGEVPSPDALVGTIHENGWVVDAEMTRHIKGYVNMLRERGGAIYAERTVRFNEYVAGTPDAFAVMSDGTLYVDDLKYGYDIVSPTTPQIVIYAYALAAQLAMTGSQTVQLGIYQPRAYHPQGIYRTRTLTILQLHAEAMEIHNASISCQSDTAEATPGTHCRYCRGASQCSAVAHETYDSVHRMMNGDQRDMTGDEIAEELHFLEFAEAMFKGRRDAVRAEAEARMKSGTSIPGWHRESGYGQRRWKIKDAGLIAAMTGVDPRDTAKMVTPLELERRGADPEVIAALVDTPRTKATLKRIPDGYFAAAFGEGK